MQRKVVLTLALIFGLASYAQAALTIVVGTYNYTQAQVTANPIVTIPIIVKGNGTSTDAVHGTDLGVQLGGTVTAVAPFGTAPAITYAGSEQWDPNDPTNTAPALTPSMWDVHGGSWNDSTDGFNDGYPTVPGYPGTPSNGNPPYGSAGAEGTWFSGSFTFTSTTSATGTVTPTVAGLTLFNLVVNMTGIGPGTWSLALLATKSGATDFVDRVAATVPVTITDGSITIVPEPTSVVLGLFAAAGLGLVAIRKRQARRA